MVVHTVRFSLFVHKEGYCFSREEIEECEKRFTNRLETLCETLCEKTGKSDKSLWQKTLVTEGHKVGGYEV